jgi:peptidoglycan/LPS O-acetylase OafA/YrhL
MKRIPTLDGWRGIAILLVVACHAGPIVTNSHRLWWRFTIGVDLFFAISGLLITSTLLYDDRLDTFYIRRAFRILPAALLYLAVVAAFRGYSGRIELISCLSFWRNYLPQSQDWVLTTHFWSLSVEEQFYLLWPAAFVIFRNRRVEFLQVAILIVNVWRWLTLAYSPIYALHHTQFCADGLMWGCMAAFISERKVPRWLWWSALLVAPLTYQRPTLMFIMPALLMVLILGTAQNLDPRVSRVLEWRPLVWVGKRSYGIYLWQQFFLFAALGWPLWVRLVALFVSTALLYRFFELPLQNLGRFLATQARTAQAVTSL